MKRSVFLVIVGFVLGAATTGTAALIAVNQSPDQVLAMSGARAQVKQDTAKTQPDPSATVLTAEEQHQFAFQNGFGDIINDMQSKEGFELEHYSLNNLITIDQNTIGLLRKISTDATRPELRERALEIKAQREAEVDQLFIWQKSWGHSHH